jgi:hypothetical protein
MAKPPEPLGELLPKATLVVDGVIAQVMSTAPAPVQPASEHEEGRLVVDTGRLSPAQTLTLEIMRVLKGAHAERTITVQKPAAGYSLLPGTTGAFLLDTTTSPPTILGRYGPDTWPLAKVEAALKGP